MTSTALSGWSCIPGDLLILVAEQSTLSDALIIPQVCRSFRQIFQQRIIWITILKAYRDRKCGPLDCPMHDDLSTRSLDNLKDLAVLALRIQRSFRSHPIQPDESPPVLSLKTKPSSPAFQYFPDGFFVGPILGTGLGIFISPNKASCWDMYKGKPVSSVELSGVSDDFVPIDTGICEASGRWLAGIAKVDHESNNHSVLVLAVDHNESFESPVISLVWRRDDILTKPLKVVLDPEMVAIVTNAKSRLSILAINLLSGREHRISTDIGVHEDFLVLAKFVDEDLHMFITTTKNRVVYHLERRFFPYTDILSPLSHLSDDSKHVIARPDEVPVINSIFDGFWSFRSNTILELSETLRDGDSLLFLDYEFATLEASYLCTTLPSYLLYDLDPIRTYSPWNVVVVGLLDTRKEEDEEKTLYLLQWEMPCPNFSWAELRFPADVDLTDMDLVIDAGKGEIIIVTEENRVLRLSYLE
ncbi:hypothetical protein C8J56DRAFT_36006 [Mycena floridula]|nr:hypothetical protein C8J56DRAFT_36006 [Mycena floridula]